MKARKREIAEEIASRISEEAFNHVSKKGEKDDWDKLGVSEKPQYKKHIISTLLDSKTEMITGSNGLTYYYNKKTNTFILDNSVNYKSTCFLPSDKEAYWKAQLKYENNQRKEIKVKETKVKKANLLYAKHHKRNNERLKQRRITLGKQKLYTKPKLESKKIKNPSVSRKKAKKKDLQKERQRIYDAIQRKKEIKKIVEQRKIDKEPKVEKPKSWQDLLNKPIDKKDIKKDYEKERQNIEEENEKAKENWRDLLSTHTSKKKEDKGKEFEY